MDPSKKIRPLPEILPERDNEKNAEKEIGLAGTFAVRKLLKKKVAKFHFVAKRNFWIFCKKFHWTERETILMTQIALLLYIKKKNSMVSYLLMENWMLCVVCLKFTWKKKNGAVLILSLNFDSVTENKKTANQYLNFGWKDLVQATNNKGPSDKLWAKKLCLQDLEGIFKRPEKIFYKKNQSWRNLENIPKSVAV